MSFISEAYKAALQFIERGIRQASQKAGPYVDAPIRDGLAFIQRRIYVNSYLNDSTPDRFLIHPYYEQTPGIILVLAARVTIVGINKQIPIEIDYERSDYTAFLSVNDGPFLQSTQIIENGGTFKLRVKTPSLPDRTVQVVVRAGGVESTWLVSTGKEGSTVIVTGLSSGLSLFASSQFSLTFGFSTRSTTQNQLVVLPASATPPVVSNGVLVSSIVPTFDSGLRNSNAGEQIRVTIPVPAEGLYRAYLIVADEPTIMERLLVRTSVPVTNIITPRLVHIRPILRIRRSVNTHIR